ncbi:MAG: heat shock protein HspQ [Methylococcales bacterium]|nr:heat shock protein HspQ [Methylococcales bacterium]
MQKSNFFIGQIIQHKLFNYKGIVVDVDFQYSGTDDWYDNVAHSRPAKAQPWYKVLVNDAMHQTYVAEQNLSISSTQTEINNPLTSAYFTKAEGNVYMPKMVKN